MKHNREWDFLPVHHKLISYAYPIISTVNEFLAILEQH